MNVQVGLATGSPDDYRAGIMRILFVDDEELVRDSMYETLLAMGYDVVVEDDGPMAIERFRDNPWYFDLVLTDMMMLQMTGDRVSQGIHAIRPDIPVVVITGAPDSLSGKAEAAGIRRVLPKALTRGELDRALRDIR